MNNEFYTKLTYENKTPDDYGPRRIEISETAWDLGLADLLEMFHGIVISATFHEISFRDTLAGFLKERYHADVIFPEDKEDEEDK